MNPNDDRTTPPDRTPPWRAVLTGVAAGAVLGGVVLALFLPSAQAPAPQPSAATEVPSPRARTQVPPPVNALAPPSAEEAARPPSSYIHLPHFGREKASADARHIATWALYSGDNEGRSVVIVDKKQAKAFVFSPEGELRGAAPVLLGAAIGDHTVPGIGSKPIKDVLPEERTTPAGRFIAEPGMSTTGEDVVWVDYDAAVSMHRVRPWVKSERRLQRLASPTPADNRISYGCINLPKAFYEDVLSPAVRSTGAVIYVLPEVSTPQEVFGSSEVRNADVLALFANGLGK